MLKYRGNKLIRAGLLGLILIVLVITVGLQPERLISLATAQRYQALFKEAGGLAKGNDVMVSGIKVGTVSDVSLRHGDALVTFTLPSSIVLGSETTAHIRTGTLLGQRVLTLQSAGADRLRRGDIIPVSRTSSPYSLTEAVSDLTTNTTRTDTQAVNQALDTLSTTIDSVSPQLGPTFDGLTRISRSLNERDQGLTDLLRTASDVTGILAERSQQVNTLILNANDLLSVLEARRQAIVDVLTQVSTLSQQLSGLVHDNEADLEPALQKLNSVTAMLEHNRDNIAKALPGLAKYQTTQAEAVSSGFFYQTYIPNMSAAVLQPFLDYAFGFRRGTDAGQPPDNAGPRAEIPFPYNGIPQQDDRPASDHSGGQP
ncbi:MCE family protein [Mycobacterium sp. OAE908]|uniref:MCE family protein n=1 Tax=Mycobacterium sp. OAE908 TaxID=2817899 RepID=UPI001AE46134